MGQSLDKLTISGFKSIRELTDFDLRNLNVFVGANGAGKSNLLDFFRLLHSIISGNLNAFVQDRGGACDLLFKGRKVTQEMFFQTRFGDRGYRFTIKPGPSDNAFLSSEARYYKRGTTDWWELGSSNDGTSLLVKEATGTHSELFSEPGVLADQLQVSQSKIDEVLAECGPPEEINDSPQTAPSKRLQALSGRFKNTSTGIAIAQSIGLATMRTQSPVFGAWLVAMEKLAPRGAGPVK